MKKLMTILLSLLLVVGLTACSGNSDKEDAKLVAENFTKALVEGDFTTAEGLCNSSVASSININDYTNKIKNTLNTAFTGTGVTIDSLNDETKAAIDQYVEYLAKKSYDSIMVDDDVEVDGDTATVIATVKYLDESQASTSEATSIMTELSKKYVEDNAASFNALSTTTEKYLAIYNAVLGTYLERVETDIYDKLTYKEQLWRITLTKENDKWTVTKLEASNNV